MVAAGCRTSDPEGSTRAGVVSRETVCLALVYAALNALGVLAADIMNAYLTGPTLQKLWTKCGPEFGSKSGRKAIITKDFRIEELNSYFKLKPDSVGPPKRSFLEPSCLKRSYLTEQRHLSKYFQDSIANLEEVGGKGIETWPKVSIPWNSKYSQELDTSPELNMFGYLKMHQNALQ